MLATLWVGVFDRPEVIQFLATHHWVASNEQLAALGVSKSTLVRARRRGAVISPVPGVIVLPGVELTLEGRALLAQLAAGREAFVSGPTAGALYGLRGMPTSRVELTVAFRKVQLPERCRLVRTSWVVEGRDVVVRDDGIRLASPARMLFGLASQFSDYRFARAAEDAWHKGLISPAQAWDFLQANRRSGRGGVKRMEAWLELAVARDRPAQSGLELDVIDIIERVGLPAPIRQYPLRLPSGETIHLDLAWPDVRLAVEPGHSWWHGGDLGQRRDQARDRACNAMGWLVVRLDESAPEEGDRLGRELATIYRQRLLAASH